MEIVLSDAEVRVLGCLIEKEMSTPDSYPLTLNALVAACNQKSNRQPVMQLDDKAVVRALDELSYRHRLAHQETTTGSRVPKYRHDMLGKWTFVPPDLAVLCELFLRGPQTVGELRIHTARLYNFAHTGDVESTLQGLIDWQGGPMVMKLPREAGHREQRWAHLFGGEPEIGAAVSAPPPEPARALVRAEDERIAALETEVVALRQAVDEWKRNFEEFKKQFE